VVRQLRLLFGPPKESRLERIERIMGTIPKVRPAARMFDEAAYREATRIAKHQAAIAAMLAKDGRLRTADKLPNQPSLPKSIGTTLEKPSHLLTEVPFLHTNFTYNTPTT